MSNMQEEKEKVTCKGCGQNAVDYFVNCLKEPIPFYIGKGAWYCSEGCFDEDFNKTFPDQQEQRSE